MGEAEVNRQLLKCKFQVEQQLKMETSKRRKPKIEARRLKNVTKSQCNVMSQLLRNADCSQKNEALSLSTGIHTVSSSKAQKGRHMHKILRLLYLVVKATSNHFPWKLKTLTLEIVRLLV